MKLTKRMRLRNLQAKQKRAIAASRKAHGIWVVLHRGKDMRRRHGAWVAWQHAVKQVQQLSAQIQQLQLELQKTATSASLDVAKAIAQWEGGKSADGRFHPYQDEVGVWTIGYGHTNADGAPHVDASTPSLSVGEAVTLLLHDLLVAYAPHVASAFKQFNWPKVTQKQFDACVSFDYNLGWGYFIAGHTIGNAMIAHDVAGVGKAMLLYDKAPGGRTLPGLTKRREWEKQLWDGGTYVVNN